MMPNAVLTITEVANLFGVTRATVTNWKKAGCPCRTVDNKIVFDLQPLMAWRRQEDRAAGTRGVLPDGYDKELESARKLRADADLRELDLAERRGELVPVKDFEARLESFLGGFAAVSAGRLQRYERDIVAAADPAAARRVTQAIHVALMEGALEYADTLEAEMKAAAAALEDEAAG